MMKRIGLLGGSFNPAHGGHRQISLGVLNALNLDEVWWLVSPGNPLKPKTGMAPLSARYASAQKQARRAPIRVTAIERELTTRYTIDTLSALRRRYPKCRFIWLMGADNLMQFSQWRNWRGIAKLMPIAVVARPGYSDQVAASPAAAWFSRFRRSATSLHRWSAPALITLRFNLDPRSASAIRETDPHWADREKVQSLRDELTHSSISAPILTSKGFRS